MMARKHVGMPANRMWSVISAIFAWRETEGAMIGDLNCGSTVQTNEKGDKIL